MDYLYSDLQESKDEELKRIENGEIEVDKLIRPLVDEINSFNDLITVNSCQGGGPPHTETAYVDFSVVDFNYDTANALCSYLLIKFGEEKIYVNMKFEQLLTTWIEEGQEVGEYKPLSLPRYKIDFDHSLIQDVTDAIRNFRQHYDL